ncbi:MAG: hypothetical protein QM696_09840 [Steroidobacteraceae bacterium]
MNRTSVSARCLGAVLAAVLFAASGPSNAQSVSPRSSARIVYVGHSLINYDMPAMVKAIADSKGGLLIRQAVQVNNGTNISNNWLGCRRSSFSGQYPPEAFACDEIDAGTDAGLYDTLIITQVNNPIIIPLDSPYNTTAVDFEKFLNLFLTKNPAGRAFFYTSWEGQGSEWHQGQEWTTRIAGELSYYEQVADRIEQISRDQRSRVVDVNIIPADKALRDLIIAAESGNFQGITNRSQLFADDVHMSSLGNYYMACVVFASVFQQSPAGGTGRTVNKWGEEMTNLDSVLARRLQDLAWKTVSEYRGWSGAAATKPKAPSSLSVQ